ncbi:MAG: PIG-L family deacetylase [Flavobacteriales bacterium]|nr:PIG-L family deacetylase [Flavobacteriales bacterium]
MHFRLSRALRFIAVTLTLHNAHFTLHTSAQRPPAQPNAAEILHRMQKLNVLGSVLYIVAHPDDENTRLIAWLANGKKVRTGNLSLTRGDGGQNLIGPELGDALGIIRTQELLEARRIDGGEQFFTRAVDFGYSKNAAESFEKWGKQEVLSDVVRVIRMFRPDVIITRFAPDRTAGHGHHEASAILAEEAFDLAGDPKAFPEQLEQGLEVWQPRRLFFNGSTWWNKDLATIAENDPDWFSVDVGGYDPLLGLSYTEIAGRSRSMHKSQGFGAAETRGEQLEYLKLIKGDRPKTKDIFEGIDMTWGRLNGAGATHYALQKAIAAFAMSAPTKSNAELLRIKLDIASLGRDGTNAWWVPMIERELDRLIMYTNGLVVEVVSKAPYESLADTLTLTLSALQRSAGLPLSLKHLSEPDIVSLRLNKDLEPTVKWEHQLELQPGTYTDFDQPYWLRRPHSDLYDMAGAPYLTVDPVDNNQVHFHFSMGTSERVTISGQLHAHYKWVDRVAGERIRPVYITPVASVIPKSDQVLIRADEGMDKVIELDAEIVALTDSLFGELRVDVPGWHATLSASQAVSIEKRGQSQKLRFRFTVGDLHLSGTEVAKAKFTFTGPKGTADRTLHEIDYPHIMPQVYYTPAEVKLVPLEVTTTAKRVGYVKGAGDDVPQALEQLGVVVEFIEPSSAKLEELKKYDAIVTGIRAYNATKGMRELHPLLLQYVEEGGTLIVQYNTTPRFFSGASDFQIDPATLGPRPFTITRGRVTVEEAAPTFPNPKHPLLNTPNKITAADFEGWVQERGLYFAGDFAPHYTPLISWNDPGEEPLDGALIAMDHGKGRFIYTGISFFRQLPAGVPGAYRLWGNLISPRKP